MNEETNSERFEIPAEGIPVQPGTKAYRLWEKCLSKQATLTADEFKAAVEGK